MRGGQDVPENTVQACNSCNNEKNDLTPLEWMLVETGGWRRAVRRPVSIRWHRGEPIFRGHSRIAINDQLFSRDDEAPPVPLRPAKKAAKRKA